MAEYQIELYRINVSENRFDRVDIITTYSNGFSFFDRLNGIGGAEFSLDIYDPKSRIDNLRRFATNIAIKRNGTFIWVGPIDKNTFRWNGVSGSVSVSAKSYVSHLTRRFSPATYKVTNQEVSTIYWDLINLVQNRTNGELLIEQGTLQTIGNGDETLNYQSIAKAIIDRSDNLNSFDFTFAPSQTATGELDSVLFNVYTGLGTVRNDLPALEIGRTVNDVTATTQNDIINDVIAEGAGMNTDVIVSNVTNASSQVANTRREAVVGFKDISNKTKLTDKANAFLDVNSVERYDVNMDIMPGTPLRYGAVSLGDVVKTKISFPNGLNINGYARIIELAVDVDVQGVEMVTPKLQLII